MCNTNQPCALCTAAKHVPIFFGMAGGGRRFFSAPLPQRQHGQREPSVRAEGQAGVRVRAPGPAAVQLEEQGRRERQVHLRGE